MNLAKKIKLGTLLPLVLFLGVLLYQISSHRKDYYQSKTMHEGIEFAKLFSAIVTETQKERGKTAVYFGNKKTKPGLMKQRAINDQMIANYIVFAKESVLDEEDEYLKQAQSHLDKINLIRENVFNGKYNLKDALVNYTGVIKFMLDYQVYLSRKTNNTEVAHQLTTLRLLEEAKESGGKLRANLSNILAKDQPINDKKFEQILKLKSGLEGNLLSKTLLLDDKQKKSIKNFFLSSDWNEVSRVFSTVLIKSKEGDYGHDAEGFFSTISRSLGQVGALIKYQTKATLSTNQSYYNTLSMGLNMMYALGCFVSFAMAALVFYVLRSTSASMKGVIGLINNEVDVFSSVSEGINSVCLQMKSGTMEQRQRLEQTVTAIDEISSMVQKSADSAKTSSKMSNDSQQIANVGQEKVENMIAAIHEIKQSSQEMEKLVDIIQNVEEKAKVINDIVFQTKLLSINASVESARAGEHGKGFAVVAEEVGNLAAVSGEAANEIRALLEESMKEVKSSVSETQRRVASGSEAAEECKSVLDEIIGNTGEINGLISEIAVANTEQATGVIEVQKNIQGLDTISDTNMSLSDKSNDMAKDVASGVNKLFACIKKLEDETGFNIGEETKEDHNPAPSRLLSLLKKGKKEELDQNSDKAA